MTPLLFVTWERFARDQFARVLNVVSVLSFRYSIVSGLNPNALEKVIHTATKAVLAGEATHPAAVSTLLAPLWVDDTKFIRDFETLAIDTGGQGKRLVKYILARLEQDASGRACDAETDPGTIEHVLPENPSAEWETMYPRASWEAGVYRLGNLTLLEASLNRGIGNAGYAQKTMAYAGSGYALATEIPRKAPVEWTPALLEKRQQRMAVRAAHVWRGL